MNNLSFTIRTATVRVVYWVDDVCRMERQMDIPYNGESEFDLIRRFRHPTYAALLPNGAEVISVEILTQGNYCYSCNPLFFINNCPSTREDIKLKHYRSIHRTLNIITCAVTYGMPGGERISETMDIVAKPGEAVTDLQEVINDPTNHYLPPGAKAVCVSIICEQNKSYYANAADFIRIARKIKGEWE